MAKQPKLVLRESCVNDLSANWPPGIFLEMGAGTGYMTRLFLDRGFSGAASDLGESSREMMRKNLAYAGDRMRVIDDVGELRAESFDYLLAFEVLEHIEDDHGALRSWARFLRPGGRVLISVPAHMRKFGRSDEITGHVRRYERRGLSDLLQGAGFDQVEIVNYGFPITELTRRLSNRMVRSDRSYENLSPEQRSIRSAQGKPKAIDRTLSLFSGNLAAPFRFVQRWFYPFDWGDGYVASAIKPGQR
jgi:SAM-dependent methyltransferase